jgi:hypothetical protein
LTASGPARLDESAAPGPACPDRLIVRPTPTASSTSRMPTINGNERRVIKPLIELFLIYDMISLAMLNSYIDVITACARGKAICVDVLYDFP